MAVAVDDHRARRAARCGPESWHGSCWRMRITSLTRPRPKGGSALSFALEMAMAPKVGLEVSPALVVFGELLTLPCAAMQSVVERELSANAALERVGRRRVPDLPGHLADPLPGVLGPGPPRGGDARSLEAGDSAAAEPDTPGAAARGADGDQRRRRPDRRVPDRQPRRARPAGSVVRARSPPSCGVAGSAVASVLDVVRRCGPPGVGATSVAECLLLQLDALDLDDERAAGPRRDRRSPAGARAGTLHLDRDGARRLARRDPAGPRADPAAAAAVSGVRRQRAARSPPTSSRTWW